MFQKLAEGIADILVNTVQDNAGLTAGKAGDAAVDTSSTQDMLDSADTSSILKSVYTMADQAKEMEAKRIREHMFGVPTTAASVNPVAKGVSDFLAARMFSKKIAPFIKNLEKEVKDTHQNEVAASGETRQQYKALVNSFLSHADPGISNYGKLLSDMEKMTDIRKRKEGQAALDAMYNMWKTRKSAEDIQRLSMINQIKPFSYNSPTVASKEQAQRRAVDMFKKYLSKMDFAVTDDNRVVGYAHHPGGKNEKRIRAAEGDSNAVKM